MTVAGLSVEVSRGALVANARRSVADDDVTDLRRDAWGHGIDSALAALSAVGARRVCVDSSVAERVASEGFETVASPHGDPHAFYGLPDGGGVPAMHAVSAVLSIKPLLAGEGVSYGYTHRADVDTWIGLVAGGYGQGVVRALGNRIEVAVEGRLRPVVGRIAMDVCVVDLGPEGEHVSPGAPVSFFGGDGAVRHSLATWSRVSGWTAAELAGGIGAAAPRRSVA